MKSLTELLAAGGLIRPVRPRGFCPACKGWYAGAGDPAQAARREVDPAALTALVVLVVAVLAWILTIAQSGSMAAMDMAMGLGSLQSFATTWLVMMAAMMLPSALPLVYEFAHNAEGRRGWQVTTAALGVAYLSVWGGALRHHSDQARKRSPLPRVVRTPWPAALQPAPQRLGRWRKVRPELHGLHGRAYGCGRHHWHDQPGLDGHH